MKVRLDRQACQGHGRCYALSPDLFDCDDEGYAILRSDEAGPGEGELSLDLDPSQEADARRAADNCPEFAITIE